MRNLLSRGGRSDRPGINVFLSRAFDLSATELGSAELDGVNHLVGLDSMVRDPARIVCGPAAGSGLDMQPVGRLPR